MYFKATFILWMLALNIVSFAYAEPAISLACTKQLVRHYYESGQYQQEVNVILDKATQYLLQRVKDNQHALHPRRLAIVLDIDETSLNNYPAMASQDFSSKQAIAMIKKADAPAIAPMLTFYNIAIKNKVNVFFITLRANDLRQATINNLHKAGFDHWAGLYLQTDRQPPQRFKSSIRKMIEAKGYDIIINIGDQATDLAGGYADKTYKLPNIIYTTAKTPCANIQSCQRM